MTKINKNFITGVFLILLLITSIDPLFFSINLMHELVLVYFIVLMLFLYTLEDITIKKREVKSILFLVGGVVLISIGQYVFSFYNNHLIGRGAIFIFVGASLILAGEVFYRDKVKIRIKFPGWKIEFAVVIVIFIIALFLRLYNINEIPLGVWFDEAQNGNEVLRLLEQNQFEIFIARFTQMPAMFIWFGALFVKVFGEGVFALRFVSVLFGSLSVVAFYFLVRYVVKDFRLAVIGALLIATSRYHIMFSRVAFLGMQTLFFEILFFYYYLRMINEKRIGYGIIAGLLLGLMLYTFSAANFVPIIIAGHLLILFIKAPKKFIREDIINVFIVAVISLAIASPLINYAAKDYMNFSKRMKDVSISKELKESGNLKPLIKNIKIHYLMFNYEGDYNGRHNLYKQPLLGIISGVLLIIGFFVALAASSYWIFIIWFIVMLMGGIMTSTIEAPQAYRVLCIIPAIYMLIVIAIEKVQKVLLKINSKQMFLNIFLSVVVSCIAIINIHQYFVIYPTDKSAYMDFAPASNRVAEEVARNSNDYYYFISPAQNMYGFYHWEQKQILEFLLHNNGAHSYMTDSNEVGLDKTAGRLGVALIVRPSDKKYLEQLNKDYPNAKIERTSNPHTDEIHFLCYYINNEDLKKGSNGDILYKR